MANKTIGVVGAATLLAGAGAAQAMPAPQHDLATVMNPTSYAELLTPIPNATELLRASDAQALQLPLARDGDGVTETVQFYHHHHHHHHHFRGPFFHHHHHGFYRRFYHHHHHHHHHFFRRDYY